MGCVERNHSTRWRGVAAGRYPAALLWLAWRRCARRGEGGRAYGQVIDNPHGGLAEFAL